MTDFDGKRFDKFDEDSSADEFWAMAKRRRFFLDSLMNPTFHWFFCQGQQALDAHLYIPGVSSLLNGIEASLRVTLAQLEPDFSGNELALSPYQVLSNTLLKKAYDSGMPVDLLKFADDEDLIAQVHTRNNVAIVQLRHDICHGNMLNFIEPIGVDDIRILTPECLRPTAARLLGLSYKWSIGLAQFRAANGLRSPNIPIPDEPRNPLAEWL